MFRICTLFSRTTDTLTWNAQIVGRSKNAISKESILPLFKLPRPNACSTRNPNRQSRSPVFSDLSSNYYWWCPALNNILKVQPYTSKLAENTYSEIEKRASNPSWSCRQSSTHFRLLQANPFVSTSLQIDHEHFDSDPFKTRIKKSPLPIPKIQKSQTNRLPKLHFFISNLPFSSHDSQVATPVLSHICFLFIVYMSEIKYFRFQRQTLIGSLRWPWVALFGAMCGIHRLFLAK